MAAAAVETAVNAAPFLAFLSGVVMWCGLLAVIACIGKYIMRGAAMAVTELFLTSSDATVEKIVRWFVRDPEIKWCVKHLIEKLGDDPKKVIEDAKKKP